MLPLLRLLADGQQHRMPNLTDQIADQLHLTDSERAEPLPSGQPRLANRVAWARTYNPGPRGSTCWCAGCFNPQPPSRATATLDQLADLKGPIMFQSSATLQ